MSTNLGAIQNDIDIDVSKNSFPALQKRVNEYLVREPEVHICSEWIVYIAQLNYGGQLIDISNSDHQKIYDDSSNTWIDFSYDLNDVHMVECQGNLVRIMPPEKLLAYKKLLHGHHQIHDLSAISSFLLRNAAGQ